VLISDSIVLEQTPTCVARPWIWSYLCPIHASAFANTHCAYLWRLGQPELTLVADYIQRWFACLKMVTNPSTKQAW